LQAEYGNKAMVELLLGQENIETDSRDTRGRTPLCFAADEAVAKLLLEQENVEADSKIVKAGHPYPCSYTWK